MKTRLICCLLLCCSTLKAEKLSKEHEIVAKTLLGEARGEGRLGLYWVATVVMQRSINRGITPAQVCKQDRQFSCWNKNDKNYKKLNNLIKTHEHKDYAIFLAKNLQGLDRVYTKKADHYCRTDRNPYWTFNKKTKKWIKPVAIIGNHKFYKLR